MAPKLAQVYPAPKAREGAPPILTRRTVAPAAVLLAASVACWAGGARALAEALLAVSTVLVMQVVAPAVRRQSLHRTGPIAELLFAAPFVLFFLPYVAWVLLIRPPLPWSATGALVAIAVGVTGQLVVRRHWAASFDAETIGLLAPLRLPTALLQSYQTLVSAVTQELFYRGALFVLLTPVLSWATVPVSAALFVLEHVANRWAASQRDIRYFARIFALAVGLGAVAYVTGSALPAVLGHVAFNSVNVLQVAYRYRVNPYRRS